MPVKLIVGVDDGKGESSTIELNMTDGLLLADYEGAALAMEPIIQNLITGVVSGMNIIVPVALPLPRPLPDVNSDVEEGALFNWATNVTGVSSRNRIPTFDEAFINPGSRDVDLLDLTVVAFLDAMSTGVGTPNVTFEDYRGADITGATSAYELFQRSRTRRR
mgnify:CR=1 FL=1